MVLGALQHQNGQWSTTALTEKAKDFDHHSHLTGPGTSCFHVTCAQEALYILGFLLNETTKAGYPLPHLCQAETSSEVRVLSFSLWELLDNFVLDNLGSGISARGYMPTSSNPYNHLKDRNFPCVHFTGEDTASRKRI